MEPVRWTVELTPAHLVERTQRMEWALQHQNRRFVAALPTDRMPIATRRAIGIGCSLLGLALTGALLAMDRRMWRDHATLVAVMFAFFGISLVASLALPRMRAGSRRLAGKMIARRAARIVGQLARRLPATFEYSLQADRIDVHCATWPSLPPISLAQGLVLAAGDTLILFRRRRSMNPTRTIHVAGDAERRAVLDAFARHGAECVEISGPTDGYSDSLPPATVVR